MKQCSRQLDTKTFFLIAISLCYTNIYNLKHRNWKSGKPIWNSSLKVKCVNNYFMEKKLQITVLNPLPLCQLAVMLKPEVLVEKLPEFSVFSKGLKKFSTHFNFLAR